MVVSVHYLVSEKSAERIEEIVTNPLESTLQALPRVAGVTSSTAQGVVDVEVKFKGGASEVDRLSVEQRLDSFVAGNDVALSARTVVLAKPRL